jgi:hypothetical protein
MYINHKTNSVYFGDKAHWQDIEVTSERPSEYHAPTVENGVHVGWEVDTFAYANHVKSIKQLIDQAAGNARQRYVSVGQMVEEEYRLALHQTKEWRAAGSPSANVPAAISDWAIASGMTDEQAATDIEQTAAYWDQVLLNIRQIRLSGKTAVDNATDLGTHDDMQNVAQPYIDQLNLMQP